MITRQGTEERRATSSLNFVYIYHILSCRYVHISYHYYRRLIEVPIAALVVQRRIPPALYVWCSQASAKGFLSVAKIVRTCEYARGTRPTRTGIDYRPEPMTPSRKTVLRKSCVSSVQGSWHSNNHLLQNAEKRFSRGASVETIRTYDEVWRSREALADTTNAHIRICPVTLHYRTALGRTTRKIIQKISLRLIDLFDFKKMLWV